ncbi:unnamed protein product, partial [Notodromas monacha]
ASFCVIIAAAQICTCLPAGGVETREAAEDRKLLELDASAKAFNTGKALPPNADHVEDHEFLTPKEISLISEIIERITKNVLGRFSVIKWKERKFNLETELEDAIPKMTEDMMAIPSAQPHDEFLDPDSIYDPDFALDDKIDEHVRRKRNADA